MKAELEKPIRSTRNLNWRIWGGREAHRAAGEVLNCRAMPLLSWLHGNPCRWHFEAT
jgi:hypothetical protein